MCWQETATRAALVIGCVIAGPGVGQSETMYAVSDNDVSVCFDLSQTTSRLAQVKHQGVKREELLEIIIGSGVSEAIADAIVNVLYSFEAADPSVYGSVMGAFCLQDKLIPVTVNR